jgi:hypothetical protein
MHLEEQFNLSSFASHGVGRRLAVVIGRMLVPLAVTSTTPSAYPEFNVTTSDTASPNFIFLPLLVLLIVCY